MKKLALPTKQQVAWHDLEMGMFIHWSPCVYQKRQGDDLSTELKDINPFNLDTDQWVDVACNLGAKYIIFVAKHIGGFCMWHTKTSEYGVRNIPWRDGKGDVMADLSESCKKRGIKLGVYICPRDDALGAKNGGRCHTPEEQERYNEIYRQQITELLTRYGDIVEVWFDGSTDIPVGDLLATYAPDAMVFQSPHATIRWVGNETGIATYPAWNAVHKADADTGVATNRHGDPNGDVWIPLECDTTIRGDDWFWSTTNHTKLNSVDQLMELYYHSVGNGAVLLLNANPDESGAIPKADAKRAMEFGNEIRRRFSSPIAYTSGVEEIIEMNLGELKAIDHIEIMEDIAFGERVRVFAVDGWDGEKWIRLTSGTAIGHKRIARITTAHVSKVRFIAKVAADQPQILKLAVYHTGVSGEVKRIEVDKNAIVVGEWGEELLWQNDGDVALDIDLTDAIPVAGQYTLKCVSTGGNVEIVSKKLLFDEGYCPNYISCGNEDDEIFLSLPGVSDRIIVSIALRGRDDFRGEVVLIQQ